MDENEKKQLVHELLIEYARQNHTLQDTMIKPDQIDKSANEILQKLDIKYTALMKNIDKYFN